MITTNNNDIMRNGTKIGWIVSDYFFDHTGKKIGFATSDNFVYDEASGRKLAHIDGDFVYDPNTGARSRLEDSVSGIESSSLSDIKRVAIKIFFGNLSTIIVPVIV